MPDGVEWNAVGELDAESDTSLALPLMLVVGVGCGDVLRMGLRRIEAAGAGGGICSLLVLANEGVFAIGPAESKAMRGKPTPANGLTVAFKEADKTCVGL